MNAFWMLRVATKLTAVLAFALLWAGGLLLSTPAPVAAYTLSTVTCDGNDLLVSTPGTSNSFGSYRLEGNGPNLPQTIDGGVLVTGPGSWTNLVVRQWNGVDWGVWDTIGDATCPKLSQTITFPQPSDHAVGEPLFTISATSTSGLDVSFLASPSSVCESRGPLGQYVLINGPGTCTVVASQRGSFVYNSAATVTRSFTVKSPQTITFDPDPLPDRTYGDAPFAVTATASSDLAVSFTASGACSVAVSTVTLTGVGNCTITAHQTGNTTYLAAPDVARTFAVNKASQTITFNPNPLPSKTYDDAPFSVSATASSSLAVSFSATGNCSVAVTTVTITGAGNCTITAKQAGNANYAAAPDVARTFTINKTNQTLTFNTLAGRTYGDDPFAVSASATSSLAVSFTAGPSGVCTVLGTTVTIVGAGDCTVTAKQAGNANYNAASDVGRTFTVAKVALTVTANDASRPFGSSSLACTVTFAGFVNDDIGAVVSGNPTCTTTATTSSPTGDYPITPAVGTLSAANYTFGPFVNGKLTITKTAQTITFNPNPLPGRTYGDAPFAVTATASSSLAVSFTASGNCSVASSTVTLTGAGNCTVTAHQAGDATYDDAPDVVRTFSISKAAQTITFNPNPLPGKTYGDAPFAVSASATSSLTVNFTAGPSGVCSVSVTTVTIVGAGNCTITAKQAGNSNYNAASDVERTFAVGKVALTVTAGATSRPFGSSSLPCTVTFAGFVNDDIASVVSGTATCTTTATSSSPIGDYPITPAIGTLSATNYTFGPFVNGTLTIGKASQTITFNPNPLPGKTYGDAPFTVSATATSSLTVSFTVGGSDQCTISGNTVTITGAGSCTVTAHQAGDASYGAAPDVARSFSIGKASQTITFNPNPLPGKTYGDAPFAVTASATSGLTVGFAASGNCSVSAGTVTITGAGTCTITASQGGNANVSAATDVPRTFSIAKASLTVTANDASRPYGSASLPCTVKFAGFVGSDSASAVSGTPTCSTTATSASAPNTYPLTPAIGTLSAANYTFSPFVNGILTIGKSDQTITFNPNPLPTRTYGDASFTVTATATSELTVSFAASGSCSVAGNSVTLTGAGECTVTASQAGNATYNAAPNVVRSFTVNKASQTITFNTLSGRTYGDAPFTVGAAATSSLTVSFTASPSGVCTVSGTTVTITGAGDCTVTAHQGGGTNYNAASDLPRTFSVSKATLAVHANNAERPFGSSSLPCTAWYDGIVNGDTAGAVSGLPTCTTTATTSSLAGTYPLTPALGSLSAANYTFGSFINGTLTILQMNTALSPVRGDTTYGDTTATLTATLRRISDNSPLAGVTVRFTIGGVSVGSATTNADGVVTLAGVAVTRRNAGSYAGLVGASFAGNDSALASTGTGALVVARKMLTVKAADRTVGLKQANPATTPPANCLAQQTATSACWLELVSGSSFAPGDNWSALNVSLLRFSYSRNPAATNASERVGSAYRITMLGVSSTNYDLRLQPGILSVVAVP